MATKSVTISPPAAQAAGCDATCKSYVDDGTYSDSSSTTTFTNYELEATPAPGWEFLRFEETYRLSEYDGRDVFEETLNLAHNPWPGTRDYTAQTAPTEYERVMNNPVRYTIRAKVEILSLVAVFGPATHTPTNLLVNSADRSTPVKLVYDPTTNLLVADY